MVLNGLSCNATSGGRKSRKLEIGYYQRESDIYEQIVLALTQLGAHVSRLSQARPSRQTAGIPDLWWAHPGWQMHGWIEVKRPGSRLSPAQAEWHAVASSAGARVWVVHSLDELLTELARAGAPIQFPC